MDIAIVGATGNVGRKTLEVLDKKKFLLKIFIYSHLLKVVEKKSILKINSMR